MSQHTSPAPDLTSAVGIYSETKNKQICCRKLKFGKEALNIKDGLKLLPFHHCNHHSGQFCHFSAFEFLW
jgi:hypothetical protein